MQQTSSEDELRDLFTSERFSFRFDCGVTQPAGAIFLSDKQNIITSIVHHFCIYSCKAELDEIRRGLSTVGFLSVMEEHPILKSLFTGNNSAPLTAGMIQDLFIPRFSAEGSNSRATEEAIMMHFFELLFEIASMC